MSFPADKRPAGRRQHVSFGRAVRGAMYGVGATSLARADCGGIGSDEAPSVGPSGELADAGRPRQRELVDETGHDPADLVSLELP